jgi:hypothetical protein
MWLKQLILCSIAASLCCAGCSKKNTVVPTAPYDVAGVKVDLPKLQAEFDNAAPELKAMAADAGSNVRYGLYVKALESLDKLSNSAGLSDSQKQTVNTVIEQLKQVVAKAGTSR